MLAHRLAAGLLVWATGCWTSTEAVPPAAPVAPVRVTAKPRATAPSPLEFSFDGTKVLATGAWLMHSAGRNDLVVVFESPDMSSLGVCNQSKVRGTPLTTFPTFREIQLALGPTLEPKLDLAFVRKVGVNYEKTATLRVSSPTGAVEGMLEWSGPPEAPHAHVHLQGRAEATPQPATYSAPALTFEGDIDVVDCP